MLDSAEVMPPVIAPLLRRHVEDAGFYWRQLDTSLSEVGLRARRAVHFAKLLEAHLEGLAVAGPAALEPALAALAMWKKPGEAFAAMFVALGTEQAEAQALVLAQVRRNPDLLLRGVVSALAWAPTDAARQWIVRAWTSGDPLLLVTALRACALRGWTVPSWQTWAAHSDSHVRAAACRVGAEPVSLAALLHDPDVAVRAEAAIRVAQTIGLPSNPASPPAAWLQAASVLWQCVSHQADGCAQSTGWNRLQAFRRLRRWLQHLAWLAPTGHPDVTTLVRRLPPRTALSFLLHHGDGALLPFVLEFMADPEHARFAGWVWQSLTGVDLRDAGLVLPDPAPDPKVGLTRAQQDADQGLALPNLPAIAHSTTQQLTMPARSRQLMGKTLSPQWAEQLLTLEADHAQALRAVAATAWSWLSRKPQTSLRTRAASPIIFLTNNKP